MIEGVTSRRGFLGTLLRASTAAIATQFGVSRAFAADMQKELGKAARDDAENPAEIEGRVRAELERRQIQVPRETLEDKRAIWYSVAGVAGVWTDRILKELAPQIRGELDRDTAAKLRQRTHKMAEQMARAIDYDLELARIEREDSKVIVETPRLRNVRQGTFDKAPYFEIAAGVEQTSNIFGSKRTRVGYIQEKIIERAS